MKWLTFIFGFYMLALSCTPCFCADMTVTDSHVQLSSNTVPKKDKHAEDEDCSPFCICSSCTSSVNFTKAVINNIVVIEYSGAPKFYFTKQDFTSYKSHNIWQPPKLS